MTNYFDFTDLKTLIISIVGGGITFFICLGIQRYWSNRSIKSLERRLKENEAYRERLNNLARSDRALLILAFQGVFAIIGSICLVIILQFLLFVRPADILGTLMYVALWSLPVLACMAGIKMFADIRDHPQSVEKVEKRITDLKNKLLGKR